MSTDQKQILVIDDHYEILQFLRSMLEVAAGDVSVSAVPSGEEGWLEVMRAPVDLVITDLRLPGMDGFELTRRVRRRQPGLPVILITGDPEDESRQTAEELGVRFFEKPLDTEALLAAVQEVLDLPNILPAPVVERADDLPAAVASRMDTLLTESRPRQLLLADMTGQILYSTGEPCGVDVEALAHSFANIHRQGNILATQLKREQPSTVHYYAGNPIDLYGAAVGQHYFILALFEEQTRRGRFTTVWLFFQRAVRDLLRIFEEEAALARRPPPPEPSVTRPLSLTELNAEIEAEAGADDPDPPDATTAEREAEDAPEPESGPPPEPLDDVELIAMLGLDLDNLEDGADVDADAFWEDVVEDSNGANGSLAGLTLEEARARGLLSASFEEESE